MPPPPPIRERGAPTNRRPPQPQLLPHRRQPPPPPASGTPTLSTTKGSLITYGNLRAKERESLEDLRGRIAAQFSDRQDGMSSIMPLFIWRGQWRAFCSQY
ncbi:hypothetical protein RHGRI_029677 [Rhododendron griersonianum]|uniref:Uncharacterized protein n=1 Tax=Rhododendron griersonianum TaxID=479676 RepID=A0AAV6IKC5_9ERIC|nr:hypothetical protein RHGRI_029677 [Rhododendron griersonianum]